MRKDVFTTNREVQTKTTKDVAYTQLKQAIIEGRLSPGERLVEAELARLLDISRTPLREALVRLNQDGFINRTPHRGAVVADVSLKEIGQLTSLRSVLEGLAAKKVAERVAAGDVDQEAMQRLEAIPEQMAVCLESNDVQRHLEVGRQFHETIWRLADLGLGATMLQQVVDAMDRYRHLVPQPRMRGVLADHQRILDAIQRASVTEAESLMRFHVEAAGFYYREAIQKLGRAGGDDDSSI